MQAKKKKRRLSDTCSLCESPVWQYSDDGTAYCEFHARWEHTSIERMRHPLDEYHNRASVLPKRLRRAEKVTIDIIKHIGYAEALWVAEHLGFEHDVQWWDGRLIIRLSDMQLVAFAAAVRAHHEALYPSRDDPENSRVSKLHAGQTNQAAQVRSRKKKRERL